MVVLEQGIEKLIGFRMNGNANGWHLTKFAVGDEPYYVPTSSQTGLANQVFEKNLESIEVISPRQIRITFVLTEEEANGHDITELGLIGSDGTMFSVETFSRKVKTGRREMVFYIDDIWDSDE